MFAGESSISGKLRYARHPFSLLEVVMVIALLGIVGGVIGMRIVDGVREHRFHASVERIRSELMLAQELMICCELSVDIELTPQRMAIRPTGLLPHGFDRLLKERVLYGIDQMIWNEEQRDELTLAFIHDRGQEMPRGSLRLRGRWGEMELYLPGHPALLSLREPPLPEVVAPKIPSLPAS